jgi:G:T/U-mismatch repair DNA glycosylase
MIETHPFGSFSPPYAKYLILGSFTTKEAFDPTKKAAYEWFYCNGGRNHFWPMLQEIFQTPLKTRAEMQQLFSRLHIALADIILQCERRKLSNLDIHLTNIVYATRDIGHILATNSITKILFTSRFVEREYKIHFKDLLAKYPQIELITLPSPSPRYVQMTKAEKFARYKQEFLRL